MTGEVLCSPTTKMLSDDVDSNGERISQCTGCECQLAEATGDGEYVNVPFRYDTVVAPMGGFCVPVLNADTNENVLLVIEQIKGQFE